MAHLGLVTRPRRHTRRQAGMGHTRQLEPTFYPGRAETDPLIPHTVQLPLDSLHSIYAGYAGSPADTGSTLRLLQHRHEHILQFRRHRLQAAHR